MARDPCISGQSLASGLQELGGSSGRKTRPPNSEVDLGFLAVRGNRRPGSRRGELRELAGETHRLASAR